MVGVSRSYQMDFKELDYLRFYLNMENMLKAIIGEEISSQRRFISNNISYLLMKLNRRSNREKKRKNKILKRRLN